MSKRHQKELTATDAKRIIELFIVRARRVKSHSLVKSSAVNRFANPSIKLVFSEDGSVLKQDIVPEDEEVFESLAARLRPFTLNSEPIYFPRVIESVLLLAGENASELNRERALNLSSWFDRRILDKTSRVFAVQILDKDEKPVTDFMSDAFIGDAWLYADLVHANPKKEKATALQLSYEERYVAATGLYSDLALHVIDLLTLVKDMVSSEEISGINPDSWEIQVVASNEQSSYTKKVELTDVYIAPVGTVPPAEGPISEKSGFEKATLTTIYRQFAPQSRAELVLFDENNEIIARHHGFFSLDENDLLTVLIDDALKVTANLPKLGETDMNTSTSCHLKLVKGNEQPGAELLHAIAGSEQATIFFVLEGKPVSFNLNVAI